MESLIEKGQISGGGNYVENIFNDFDWFKTAGRADELKIVRWCGLIIRLQGLVFYSTDNISEN